MGEALGSPSVRLLREGGGQSWRVLWKVGDSGGREPRDSAAPLTSLLGAAPEKALNRQGAWGLSHESAEPSVGRSESGSGSCGGSQQSRGQLRTQARGGRSELGGAAGAIAALGARECTLRNRVGTAGSGCLPSGFF